MKRKNLKKTLAMVSVLALSAQLILPTAIFAEGDADTNSPAERPGMTAREEGKDFKDDIIFIGSFDTNEDTDKSLIKCISFGMHGGKEMKSGMSDKEPPEKPDGEPPAKPESNGESIQRPDSEPPEKPDDEKFKEMNIEISEGDTISITTSDGTVLETVTADKDAKGVVFSSDALVQDETYTLLINGEAAANAELIERSRSENGEKDDNTEFKKTFDQNFENSKNNEGGRNNMPPRGMDMQDMPPVNRNSNQR